MYGVSSNFLTAVQQAGRVFKSQAIVTKTGYSNINLADAQIISIKHSAASISGEDFEIGATCAAELDMTIANLDGSLSAASFQGATVTVSIGIVLADTSVEYCPLGVFYVDSVSRTETSIKLVCYDAMLQLETLYKSNLTYPATLLQIAQDIASKAGLALATTTFPNSAYSVAKMPNLGGITLRAALSWVAQAAACFARISRSGQLELAFYASSSTTITIGNYYTLTHDEQARAAITQVAIKQDTDDAGVNSGTTGNTYTITGNPLLVSDPSGALTAIYNQLKTFTYMPFTSKWQGNPACMAGDIISITDRSSNTYTTILTESEIEYDGGLTGNATAKALTDQAQAHQTSAAVASSVAEAATNVQTINNLLAGNLSAENLAAGTITADKIAVKTITAASGVIADAAISTAQIADASITGAKIGSATITTANIANAAITTAQIASATITAADIANATITNAQIASATITAAQIASATITSAQIANATITAAKIANATITNAQISSATITAANIANATITAAQIANAAVGTAQIASGAITTALIGTGAINTAQIADGSITDAKIVGLTANKITAGTIDASVITVTNLNCANLTVGTINGTQIATGAISSTNLATAVNTSISTAQTTATNAATVATAAQTSANGKNTIYRQSTQPSGGTYTAGDIWLDTGNGNRVYVYSGSAWTLSQLGYQAISSIDAGTISTGTLSAARIAAGTITADKLVIGDFTNMCTNPKFLYGSSPWTCSRIADPQVNSTAAPTAYVGSTSSRDNLETTFQVNPGDQYYCSLAGIPSSANFPLTIGLYFKDKSGAAITWASCGSSIPTTATTWTTISGLITVPANAVTATVWVQISNSSTISGTWYFTNVIVNHITGATLIGSGAITTAKIAANAVTAGCIAANCITASQIAAGTITATQISTATITGDRLVANTITASQIAAGTITADKINTTNLYAQRVSTSATNFYTTMGNFTINSNPFQGLFVCSSANVPCFSLVVDNPTGSYYDMSMYMDDSFAITTGWGADTQTALEMGGGVNAQTGGFNLHGNSLQDGGQTWVSGTNTSGGGWVTEIGAYNEQATSSITLDGSSIVCANAAGTYTLGGQPGNFWLTIPTIGTSGVMEVGQYIDFHESKTDTSDYSSRLYSSGGTIVTSGNFKCLGQINVTGSAPQIYGNGSFLQLCLDNTNSSNGLVIAGGTVRPPGTGQVNLGASGHRWATVYAATGTINTSDRNEKNTIEQLDADKAVTFIAALNPVSYKLNDGTSGRTHYGMIAQDVEDTMNTLGMASTDFAGFVKSPKTVTTFTTDADGNENMTEQSVDGEYIYGLRYEEFISPLIKTVQGLLTQCAALEETINEMQATKTAG